MLRIFKHLIAGLVMCTVGGMALASERATADEAVAMVKRAVAYYKAAKDKEKALAEFSNQQGTFRDRDLYVMAYDKKGNCMAHGANAKLIGRNLIELKDADGIFIVKGLVDTGFAANGRGWVDYRWPNPVTKVVEPKTTYVELADDVVIGVGVYK
jgi:signal transduction histidine kinase